MLVPVQQKSLSLTFFEQKFQSSWRSGTYADKPCTCRLGQRSVLNGCFPAHAPVSVSVVETSVLLVVNAVSQLTAAVLLQQR